MHINKFIFLTLIIVSTAASADMSPLTSCYQNATCKSSHLEKEEKLLSAGRLTGVLPYAKVGLRNEILATAAGHSGLFLGYLKGSPWMPDPDKSNWFPLVDSEDFQRLKTIEKGKLTSLRENGNRQLFLLYSSGKSDCMNESVIVAMMGMKDVLAASNDVVFAESFKFADQSPSIIKELITRLLAEAEDISPSNDDEKAISAKANCLGQKK